MRRKTGRLSRAAGAALLGFLLCGGSLHAAGENPLLTLNPGVVIWTWISFFILLVLLWKFAWKRILALLDEREGRISKALEDAECARKSCEEAVLKQKEIIAHAETEAGQIIIDARKTARMTAQEIQERATRDYDNLIIRARQEIENEKRLAVTEIRKEAADLAVDIAAKLLDGELDAEKHRKLARSMIARMGQGKN